MLSMQLEKYIIDLVAQFKSKANNIFNYHWAKRMSNCVDNNVGKLCTYALYKNIFSAERYLYVIKDGKIWSYFMGCFTKFRISTHRLQIEYDWYQER